MVTSRTDALRSKLNAGQCRQPQSRHFPRSGFSSPAQSRHFVARFERPLKAQRRPIAGWLAAHWHASLARFGRSRILSVKTGAQVQFFLQIQPPGLANRKQPRIKSIGPVALYLATDIHNLWQPPNRQSQHMWHSLAICGNRQRGPGYEHPVDPHSQRAHFPARTIAKLPHSGHSSPV